MSNDFGDDYEDGENGENVTNEIEIPTGGLTINISADALNQVAANVAARLEERLLARAEKSVEKKLVQIVDEVVRKVIGDMVEPLVISTIEKPRQKTNTWGEPTGPTVTFAEQIPAIVQSWLDQTVNAEGRPDSYGKATRGAWIIAAHVKAHIDPVTTQAVANITKQARDVVSQKIAAFVSEQMIPAIEVKRA